MIHVVLGTKEQLIKMAPIMVVMRDRNIPYRFISTGQHRDTMNEILDNFELRKPDLELYSGPDITSIGQMFLWALRLVTKSFFNRKTIFGRDKHGIVLVHGDTFSTLIGALMGRVAGLKIGHVESGLRSFNIFQPFPEELTRLATFRLSHIYFCAGNWAIQNLKRYKGEKVNTHLNTLFDSLVTALPIVDKRRSSIVPDHPFGIVTLHRFENFRDQMSTNQIVEKIELIAQSKKLLFILHKPTERALKMHGFYERLESNPNIELRPRYDYFQFISLMRSTEFVISDGGSNQEECYYLGIPALLLRNVTERQEGIGRNIVVSKFDDDIIKEFMANLMKYRYPLVELETRPSELVVSRCKAFA
jgi:UDP-N-acetylglucosamine 2-epimerase (non-hydrolysing)